MKVRILVATTCGLLLALLAAPAQAQDQVGVKAGVNLAKVSVSAGTAEVSFDQRAGLVAGFFFVTDVSKPISIQPEILFSQKGTNLQFGATNSPEESLRLTYIEVPVLARFNVSRSSKTRPYLLLGPSLAANIKAKAVSGTESETIDSEIEFFDLGMTVGAGVDAGRFVADVRYTLGLRNIAKDTSGDEKMKNRTLAVTVGVRIK